MSRDDTRAGTTIGEAIDHIGEALTGTSAERRDVGVSTRHAHQADDDDEVDAQRVVPGRPTFPIGTEPSDDGAPTSVVDFEPRDATPPSTAP